MINGIEKALSNRSTCTKCKGPIEVGDKRGYEKKCAFGHATKSYYCKKCTKGLLEEQIAYSQKLLAELA